MDKVELQKIYNELGRLITGVIKEARRSQIIKNFCKKRGLPIQRARKHFNPEKIKITKRLQRKMPQLPFS